MILRLGLCACLATMLLGLGSAASVKELHNDTQSVGAPQSAREPGSMPDEDFLRRAAAPGLTFDLYGESWMVHQDPTTQALYFHSKDKGVTQWGDPRAAELRRLRKQRSPRDRRLMLVVGIIPLVVFVAVILGRITYLQKYYPELLWPTKERKARKKFRNREKMPKSRFKVSQDGKGGRSANS